MIRLATAADLPALRAFLYPRAATSLFLSSGLEKSWNCKDITYWIALEDRELQAVFGRSKQGYLLCEAPNFDPDWADGLRRALSEQKIIGINGEARQVANLRRVLGLDRVATTYDQIEPLFQVHLDDLILPPGSTQMRDMDDGDLALIRDWRLAYDREVYGEDDAPELRQRSEDRAARIIRSGSGRLLELDGTPVAMTSFNAVLADVVQVGSVYTPPPLRGQGHARRVVALHLAQARSTGVRRAILYSLSVAATQAYQSIGFTRIGDYAVMDFAGAVHIGDSP